MTSSQNQADREITTSKRAVPAYLLFQRVFFATCIILTPVVTWIYAFLNPTSMGARSGQAAIAVNMAANPVANQLHLILGIMLSFLLPLSFLGMAWLCLRRAPWLATIAGFLSLVGWIPWSALIGQEALTYTMAQMGGATGFALLWERFNADFVIRAYLLTYIIGHLAAQVLLAYALGRRHLIPAWAAWAFGISSPLQIVAFAVRQPLAIHLSLVLWILASIPTALAVLRFSDETRM